MLHKLKPIPRAIIIVGIVAAVGFGLTQINLDKIFPKKETEQVDPPTVVEPKVPEVPKVQEPAQEQPQVPPAVIESTPINSGLSAVIEAGQK